jgi:hypothetical protein
MASINAVEVTRDMLAYTLATDKESLKKLLVRNGINVPSDASDKQLTTAILIASGKSSLFKSELSALLSSKIDSVNKDYSNFVGGQFDIGTQEDKTMFTGSDDFFSANGVLANPSFSQGLQGAASYAQKNTAKKQPKEKGKVWSWLGENVFTKENINSGINMGLTALNNKIQTKKNQVDTESTIITEKQDAIINQSGGVRGVSVGTVVLIVAGIGLVGAMVYYFSKK